MRVPTSLALQLNSLHYTSSNAVSIHSGRCALVDPMTGIHGREILRTILDTSKNDTTVVFGGSSAGGVGAFNTASWLLDTFEQVGTHA